MKKRAVCLLMSAVLVASVLSGCGDKNSDSRAEEAMNDFGSAMEAGDEDAAMSALEEFDNISEGEEDQDLSDGGEVYPADPRWADVKPTELAIQFNDVFIKTGMPLGEVMEEINNSDTFFVPLTFYSYDPDTEIKNMEGITDSYGSFDIKLGDDTIYYSKLPWPVGEWGETCFMKDIPIISFQAGLKGAVYGSGVKNPEMYHTALGTYEDIANMSSDDVENLKDTFFAGLDVELTSERTTVNGVNYIRYEYTVPSEFSWNGYSLRNFVIHYGFYVDYEKDRVVEWSISGTEYFYWDQQ